MLKDTTPGTQHIASQTGKSHISDPAISSQTLFTTEPLPLLTSTNIKKLNPSKHDVKTSSYQHRCALMMSHNVDFTFCVYWDRDRLLTESPATDESVLYTN